MTTHFSHITVPYACPFSMPNLPFLLIWLLSYRKWLRPLSYRYDNHLLDLFWIFFWIILGRSLIDMTTDHFRIDMIMTEIFLSKWLNSPIEMTAHSYWYEGKERRFFTLCYLSIRQSFFLSLGQENLKVIFSKRESSLQVIWPFILGIENTLDLTVNPRPKTLNSLSFQSDRRFVKNNLLKSI